jgi:chromosome condensin MukBEF MukE localization factor
MSVKSIIAKQFAKYIYRKTQRWANNPVKTQKKVFQKLIAEAKETSSLLKILQSKSR